MFDQDKTLQLIHLSVLKTFAQDDLLKTKEKVNVKFWLTLAHEPLADYPHAPSVVSNSQTLHCRRCTWAKKNYYPSLLLEKKSELCRSFYAFLFCFFCSSLFPTSSMYNKIQSAYEPVIWYSVSETSPVIRLLTNQNWSVQAKRRNKYIE